MTTTLAAPPPQATVPPPTNRRAPRQAIARWAWRMLRREWRQQVLILVLLVVAMGVTTVGLGLVVNVQSSDQAVLGSATTRLDIANPGSGVAADIAAAHQRFGAVEAIEHASVPVPGSITPIDLRAQDPHGRFGSAMLRLVSGSFPNGPDEVALTSTAASTFGLKVGDNWSVLGRAVRVVGIVENPKDLRDTFVLVPPGQISDPQGLTVLTASSGSSIGGFRPPAGSLEGIFSTGASGAEQRRNQALAVLLLDTIGLTFIGLLAVAGFTVVAQRRLRSLGMIAATGANDRQIRLVMLANGAAVGGAVGSGIGTALGLVVWFGLRPAFEHVVGHRVDVFALPWWAVLAAAALAVVTAVAASWWPARSAARMPIVAALSGRPPAPQPAHRFALLGSTVTAVGFVLLVLSHERRSWYIVSGILATTVGMLLLAPLGIRLVAALGRCAPVAVRLALRDLARYQARSGAALAAAGLAVGIAATIAISAAGAQAADRTLTNGNLPTNELLVWLNGNPSDFGGPGVHVVAPGTSSKPSLPSAGKVAQARSAADKIASATQGSSPLELDAALDLSSDVPSDAPPGAARASVVKPLTINGKRGYNLVTTPYIATPAVLAFYGIAATDVSPSTDILTSRTDLGGDQLQTIAKRGDGPPAHVQVDRRLPMYTSAPNTLLTPAAASAMGLTAEPVGWLVRTPHALTTAQLDDARHDAAAAGVTIESRTAPDRSLQKLRNYATTAGLLVALGVLAMTVGLIRSETAGDLRTLTATGASSSTRRTLTAATAGALALLGGLLGTAGAYVALIAWHWHHVSYLSHPPYAHLAVLVVGLPAAAVVGGWLFGRTPGAIARRRLD